VTAVKTQVPANLHLGKATATDLMGKAELLNQHFVSVYNKIEPEEIFYSLATTRTNVATCPDDISSVMLHQTASTINILSNCNF